MPQKKTRELINLSIEGYLEINNAYTFPTIDGIAGYILTTDGLGNVTWQKNTSSAPLSVVLANGNTTGGTNIEITQVDVISYLYSTYRLDLGIIPLTSLRKQSFQDADGTIALTSDIPASIVETVTTTNGSFIDLTPIASTAGAVTVTADLSATGTADATTFLRGDNTWSTPSSGGQVDSVAGTVNKISISGTAVDPIVDIASTYIGQTSITTLGTITTGLWNGTAINQTYLVGQSGTNTGDQTITLTGDITGSGTGSFVTTIGAGAVDIPMLSASGTADSTTFLRGDNVWAALPAAIYNSETSGIFEGGVLSINATTSLFDVSAGTGQIVDPTVIPVVLPTPVTIVLTTGITLTAIGNDFTYVLITNTGAILQQATSPTPQQLRTHIFLGKINHANHTTITSVINQPTLAVGVSSGLEDLMRDGIGMINATPILPFPATLLNISTNVGTLWKMGSNYNIDKNSPHQTVFSAYDSSITAFPYLLSDGTIHNPGPPLTNDVRPAIYESSTGVTSVVPALKWTNQRIYITITGGLLMMYGQTTYNSRALALEFLSGENHLLPPVLTTGDAILIGIVTLVENTTDLNTTDALFQNASKFGEFARGGVSTTATTLQGAYDNSSDPEIVIPSGAANAFSLEADTDGAEIIQDWKDEAQIVRASMTGDGNLVVLDINGVAITNGGSSTNFLNESGTYSIPSSGITTLRNVTATDTFATANETINCTANTFTVNLPTAAPIRGTTYTLVNSGTGVITLAADGTETINGSLTIDLSSQYISRTVQSDGTNWIII